MKIESNGFRVTLLNYKKKKVNRIKEQKTYKKKEKKSGTHIILSQFTISDINSYSWGKIQPTKKR